MLAPTPTRPHQAVLLSRVPSNLQLLGGYLGQSHVVTKRRLIFGPWLQAKHVEILRGHNARDAMDAIDDEVVLGDVEAKHLHQGTIATAARTDSREAKF